MPAVRSQWAGSPAPELSSPSTSPARARLRSPAKKPPPALSHNELQEALSQVRSQPGGPLTSGLVLARWEPMTEQRWRAQHLLYDACRSRLHEPSLVLQLFYGAPRQELEQILHSGFEDVPADPLGLASYGRGWYFSKYAAHAHHYTAGGGCVLLAQVAVGNTETVVREDASRGAPSHGFDSIVVPGRRLPSNRGSASTSGARIGPANNGKHMNALLLPRLHTWMVTGALVTHLHD